MFIRSRLKCSHVVSPLAIKPNWKRSKLTERRPNITERMTQLTAPTPERAGNGGETGFAWLALHAIVMPKDHMRTV